MLLEDLNIIVYEMSNSKFEPINPVNQYTALEWNEPYIGCGDFELWAPITKENSEILKPGNVVWCGKENIGVIEIIEESIDKDGVKSYDVRGRTLEKLFYDRIIWGTVIYSGNVSTIMYNLVKSQCTNPTDSKRKIPYLECAVDRYIGPVIKFQETGGFVYDALKKLADEYNLGFNIIFDQERNKLIFNVSEGKDRSIHNTQGLEIIELNTEMDDILASEYYINIEDDRNVAFVQGEANEDAPRTSTISGLNNLTGLNRKEIYVDARDLQSEVYVEGGQTEKIPQEEYIAMLQNRGNEKLGEYSISESFSAEIRQLGSVQYQYGVDYFKGDKITVIDNNLKVTVDATISNVAHKFDDEYSMEITFGFSYPTIIEKVKRATT